MNAKKPRQNLNSIEPIPFEHGAAKRIPTVFSKIADPKRIRQGMSWQQLMRCLPVALILPVLIGVAYSQQLRLIDLVPNPGVAQGEYVFGRSLDWDDSEIIAGSYPSVHIFDSTTRAHKYRLGADVKLPEAYALGSAVIMTPEHFVSVASQVNRADILYVFRRSDGGLVKTIPSPPLSTYEPSFGADFALQGNRLFVSILHNSPVSGATAVGGVLVYDIRNWVQETQMFRSADGEWFDGFGSSISVEGDILAVGAGRKNAFNGAAYLFNATTRALIAKVTMPVPTANEWFGTSVLLHNGKLYVTSRSAVWEYDGNTGAYLGKYSPSPATGTYDGFGSSLEIVGNGLLAVWSQKFIYQFDTGTRKQIAALRSPLDSGSASTAPGAMKARGDILLTGASGGTDPATSKGALLAFTNAASEPVVEIADATGSETEGAVTVLFKVNPPATREVTVDYRTRQESAREGMDFIAAAGTVKIPAGQTTAELRMTVINDKGYEPKERFFLDILGGTGAVVTPGEVELWITDNDPAFPVTVGNDAQLPLPSFPKDELGETIAAFGSTAFVSCPDVDGSGKFRGGVFVIDLQTRKIVTTLAPAGLADGAYFGQGLAVDNELLAIGTFKSLQSPFAPAIYLYDRKSLTEKMILHPPASDAGGFGQVIALGARHILVGLPYEDRRGFQVGDVLVYDRATGAFMSRIESPSGSLGGQFGFDVQISGGRSIVGGGGRAYCFDLDNNNRMLFEMERSTRDTSHVAGYFGETIQANEKYIAMGNPWDDSFQDNSGSVLVFDAATGTHLHTIRDPSGVANANFGRSISLQGDVLAIPGAARRIHLMDIATGHERMRFTIPYLLAPNSDNGYKQEIVLTSSNVVTGLPWGRANYLGTVLSFSRDKVALQITAAPQLDRQSGLQVGRVMVSNSYPISVSGFRIYVRGLPPGARLQNAAGTGGPDSLPYLLYNQALGPQASVELTAEFYVPDRGSLSSIKYEIEPQGEPEAPIQVAASGMEPSRIIRLNDGSMLIEMGVEAGKTYRIEYACGDLIWKGVSGEVKASSNRLQWIDNGPPKTECHPSEAPTRFYRFVESKSSP